MNNLGAKKELNTHAQAISELQEQVEALQGLVGGRERLLHEILLQLRDLVRAVNGGTEVDYNPNLRQALRESVVDAHEV